VQALDDRGQFLLLTGTQEHQTHAEPSGRKSRIDTHGVPVSRGGPLQTARIPARFAKQITGRRGTGIDGDSVTQCRHRQIRAAGQALRLTQHVPRIDIFRGPLEDFCVRLRAAREIPKTDPRVPQNEPSVRIAWIQLQPLLREPCEALPVLALLEVRY
jgi:hypothetical protein